ncbi:hypothetical protein BJY24_001629 [Nocardia transvalensis]|uniref:Uncharacterized protein n=1 Tax=Nocardia transvalensis TaxID=37333 RepID=A0A7W9PB15_9NOCA|nr:hypothetical protein [Nocardia transvalensis]MBB5912762.1 hypothetical protein [Nocardia transvalensis]
MTVHTASGEVYRGRSHSPRAALRLYRQITRLIDLATLPPEQPGPQNPCAPTEPDYDAL